MVLQDCASVNFQKAARERAMQMEMKASTKAVGVVHK